MKTTVTINGITKEIELSPEQAKQFQIGRVEANEKYFWIDNLFAVQEGLETFSKVDDDRFNSGNYYKNIVDCQEDAKANCLRAKLSQFNRNFPHPEGSSSTAICACGKQIMVDYTGVNFLTYHQMGALAFSSHEAANAAIAQFKNEILWYFNEYVRYLK